MTVREYAKAMNFEVAGKLKRVKDGHFGIDGHYPIWIDEAGNEYLIGKHNMCIVTVDGGVI